MQKRRKSEIEWSERRSDNECENNEKWWKIATVWELVEESGDDDDANDDDDGSAADDNNFPAYLFIMKFSNENINSFIAFRLRCIALVAERCIAYKTCIRHTHIPSFASMPVVNGGAGVQSV